MAWKNSLFSFNVCSKSTINFYIINKYWFFSRKIKRKKEKQKDRKENISNKEELCQILEKVHLFATDSQKVGQVKKSIFRRWNLIKDYTCFGRKGGRRGNNDCDISSSSCARKKEKKKTTNKKKKKKKKTSAAAATIPAAARFCLRISGMKLFDLSRSKGEERERERERKNWGKRKKKDLLSNIYNGEP